MSVEIRKVTTKKELKRFIRFNYELYKGNPYSVPDLYEDIRDTFSKEKNAALEFCEAEYFLAYREGKIVGRVAAIINKRANEAWNQKIVRFGWIDFIDDLEVSTALIDTVKQWGRERGMTEIQGPLGFTDMDAEGMLVEGFDQISTMATIYNYDYYPRHIEQMGMEKAADWVEMKLYVPDAIPEKHQRIAKIVCEKYGLHIVKLNSKKKIRESGIAHEIFRLINEAFKPLFGYSEMTEKQIDQYVKTYLPILDLRMVTLVQNDKDELVAVGISMASLSVALQKAKGKLFPFGWWHLAKALFWKRPDNLDLLLVAVRPDYQKKGANALLFTDLIPVYQKMGFRYAESNPELESNANVQNQWQYFDSEVHKRRRCFKQEL
ncbi:N-acetyltransferase [Pseudoprevotella muciniphila]|uniref:N-acetyltransferase n=1 Tax=Pseudoprevotella muciniphila TaxID=2133944 RepID=A0A5P8E780_9BACT|nr:N-acetyltransferase [Pseudoprevotella muciniphila]QFQ12909.1 N-acetyltransferase [Pseudoprevotella muciniphila]